MLHQLRLTVARRLVSLAACSRPSRQLAFCCLCCCAAVALTACSEGDNPGPAAVPTISVVKNDLLFEPAAATATVEVSGAAALTATVDADWCSATVSGNTVTVAVSQNTSFEGRTALLLLTDGDARLQLPVQQRGMALGSLAVDSRFVSNSGGRFSYYIRHDLPMDLSCDVDWMHAEMQGDSLIVDVDANDTRYIRRGILSYACGGYEGELTVSQYDPKANVEGAYILGGTMAGQELFITLDLYYQNDSTIMVIDRVEEWRDKRINLDFDPGKCELLFRSLTILYEKNSNSDVLYLYDADGGVATAPSISMTARLFSNPLWRFATYATLEDNGSWTGSSPLSGLLIRSVRGGGLVVNNLVQFDNPYILRIGPVGTRM